MSETSDNWYYVKKGQHCGPLNLEQIRALVSEGAITSDTSVWPGAGEWLPASQTALGGLFTQANVPPPLTGSQVGNQYVWASIGAIVLVTAAQLANIASGASSNTSGIWSMVFVVATLVFLYLDERKVRKAGHPSPASWWMLVFLPAYYWRRARLLGQRKHHFWIWIGLFVLSNALVMGITANQKQQDYTIMIEQNACPMVTKIIQQQLGGNSSCVSLTLGKEMSSGFYKANALLDNGNVLHVTVQDPHNGNILVKVPPQ